MHKRLTVFLSTGDIKRIQTVCDTKNCSISNALSKLVRAGFEALGARKKKAP